jgi:hypothetical protein
MNGKRSEGWVYIKSKILKEAAFHPGSQRVYTEDKVLHTMNEIRILDAAEEKAAPDLHLVKNIFEG